MYSYSKNFRAGLISLLLGIGVPPAFAQDSEAGLGFVSYGDARLRYDHTYGIADEFERTRARVNVGALYLGVENWEFGFGARLHAGTDDPRFNRRNRDNERTDRVGIDQFYARWQGETLSLQAGKSQLPMNLTPLVWDADLRPIGVSASGSQLNDAGTGLGFALGYFAPDFEFDNEKTRLAALQIGWHWQQGQPTSLSALISYLRFDDLDGLPANGVARTNRRLGANYLSDYELLDLQLIGRTELWDKPLTVVLDGTDNQGANDLNQAGRVSIALGSARNGGFEYGLAYQRNQRDAVLAVAADDEWWFQSFSRGAMAWVGYGFTENTSMRLAGLSERRDGVQTRSKRVLFDLATQW